MAIKLTDLADKLKMTKLQLRRELKNLDIEGLDPKKTFFKREIASEIMEKLGGKAEGEESTSVKVSDEKNEKEIGKVIEVGENISVKNFASKLNLPVTDVIKELMRNGVAATINEKIDYDTASIIASDFGYTVKEEQKASGLLEDQWSDDLELKKRPPVVTILGHVDHGKTTLLDKIRKKNVAGGESGGITQHIGAYQVELEIEGEKQKITFIDTPGHKAFTAMRAQGAKVTDIAILIVAADDSVQPQTREALDHIKQSGVPIVIAINKIDLPGADINKVKQDLIEIGLTPEDLGGTTPTVEISAKKGENIDSLLEILVLTAEMQDLKAPYENVQPKGVVIESHKHKGAGVLATVLIKQGVMEQGKPVLAGTIVGTARIMEDENNERVDKAYPSQPVRIIGFDQVPAVGTIVEQFENIKEARKVSEKRIEETRKQGYTSGTGLIEASKSIKKGESKQLKIILKADVAGSLEALSQSITGLGDQDTSIDIIKAGVGPVNESDIEMATASNAVIISFRMPIDKAAASLAKQNNIEISEYEVIYKLIDDLQAALEGLLEPIITKEKLGQAKVLKVFFKTSDRMIVGCKLNEGEINKTLKVEIKREEEVIGKAEIISLQKDEKEVDSVKKGQEFGIGLKTDIKIKEDDQLFFYRIKKEVKHLNK
jgi:translation initiation factor IF-2